MINFVIVKQTTGNVGINTITPSEKLTVSGNTYISGNLTASTISATTISASTINTGTIEVTETGTTQLIRSER